MVGVKFVPLSPAVLVSRLARWIDSLGQGQLAIGFDGPPEVGTADLADRVGDALHLLNRNVIRVSTNDWLRAASVRLEYGKQDLESRMTSWVDIGSLRRELFDRLGPGGDGQYLTTLRDPHTDRATRQPYRTAPDRPVLLLDGPLLLTHDLPLAGLVRVGTSPGALQRALPERDLWQVAAHTRYRDEFRPHEAADVVLSYDHPNTPAAAGLPQ